jgi:transcriptional regulator with XRE-family HTH domain
MTWLLRGTGFLRIHDLLLGRCRLFLGPGDQAPGLLGTRRELSRRWRFTVWETDSELGGDAGEDDDLAEVLEARNADVGLPAADGGVPRLRLQELAKITLAETPIAAPAAQQLSKCDRRQGSGKRCHVRHHMWRTAIMSSRKLTLDAMHRLDFAERNIYTRGMTQTDPFAGLGKALARLRKRAGFATQTLASEALKVDKGQLSRWENEVPRPTLENLSRLMAGYGATVTDLAAALGESTSPQPGVVEVDEAEAPRMDDGLIRALAEAIRRVEGRQVETETRVERIERGLEAATRPSAPEVGSSPPAPRSRASKG